MNLEKIGDVKKSRTAKKRKNIESTMVSISVTWRTKVGKTQEIEFFQKISFLLRDKIHPRRTPVRLTGGCLPVPALFSYPLRCFRGCKETHVSLHPLFCCIKSGRTRGFPLRGSSRESGWWGGSRPLNSVISPFYAGGLYPPLQYFKNQVRKCKKVRTLQ